MTTASAREGGGGNFPHIGRGGACSSRAPPRCKPFDAVFDGGPLREVGPHGAVRVCIPVEFQAVLS